MTNTVTRTQAVARRWPLMVLALPAMVAIWSGWVGLGEMAGFGVVHPLPGIADSVSLNTAITLPIGVEAYSAYALGTWLSPRGIRSAARRFAAWSAGIALLLGLVGQVLYHLLTAAGYQKAPGAVVIFVACLPVLVLGAGAALHHLLGDPATDEQLAVHQAGDSEDDEVVQAAPARDGGWLTQPATLQPAGSPAELTSDEDERDVEPDEELVAGAGAGVVGVDVTELLEPGREVVAELVAAGQRLTRKALIEGLRARGLSCSTDRARVLLAALRVERADHIGRLEAVAG
jgi:hypothetical protein